MTERARARLESALARLWFQPARGTGEVLASALLSPLSYLTAAVSRGRRRRIVAHRDRAAGRPTIVVIGNLVVGGAGKTPLVAAIASSLAARGLACGIVSRGYRRRVSDAMLVDPNDDAARAGDEPLMLARETGLPVAVGADRGAALARLLEAHPALAVVVCDDGLQHEGLARDVEIAVFDARGIGNGRLLPAGPLREPLAHVDGMDAVVVNGGGPAPVTHRRMFASRLEPVEFVALDGGTPPIPAGRFAAFVGDRPVLAVAGIASPERFFETLVALGIRSRRLPLGDHARIDPAAIVREGALVVTTMKDAVKWPRDIAPDAWALRVAARCDASLIDWLEAIARGQATSRDPGVPALQGAPPDAARPPGRPVDRR